MKQYKNKIFSVLSCVFVTAFFTGFAMPSLASSPIVEDIEYIYLHRGLDLDYSLPAEFKKEKKLKFEGNYKRYVSAKYNRKKNQVLLQPKRVGSAVLVIKNDKNKVLKRLSINIQKDNLHKIVAELKDLLITIDGIEIKIYNKKVIIDGQVLLPEEMDRIKTVISDYSPKLVKSVVRYSPLAQKKIAERIEKEIGYPEVTVKYAYNRFRLEGCVATNEEKLRALNIASFRTQFEVSTTGDTTKRKGVPIVKNDIRVPCEAVAKEKEKEDQIKSVKKLIQVVVHFVEMEKSFDKGFLFQWTPAVGDSGTQVTASLGNHPQVPTGITGALTATIGNFFPKLNWAKSFDFARVLHNSSILIEENKGGSINITTNVPQKTADGNIIPMPSAGVIVGVKSLEIKGERKDLVSMELGIIVSSPGTGGIVKRELNTTVYVQNGASAVIGGIMSSFLSRSYNKSPASVTAQPILNLLSQKGYGTKKSQFAIFVTPLIKSSASTGVARIKKKFKLEE